MPVTRFWELLAGSLLALYVRQDGRKEFSDRTLAILSLIGVAIAIHCVWTFTSKGFPGYKAVFVVIGASLIIYAGSVRYNKTPLFNRLLSLKPIVAIGLISYPLYLWHWVIISYCAIISAGEIHNYKWIKAALIVVAILLSIATYFIVERPIRFGKTRKGLMAFGLLVALIAVGGVGAGVYIKGAPQDRWLMKNHDLYGFIEKNPWGITTMDACSKRYAIEQDICLQSGIGAKETILIIGDSHTLAVFNAIAEYNKDKNVNTLALGRYDSANHHIMGDDINYRSLIIETVNKDSSIKKIYIAMIALSQLNRLGAQEYGKRLQSFVNEIKASDRKIYLVEDHPTLPAPINNYFVHPLNIFTSEKPFLPTRQYMLENSKEFYEVANSVKGLTLIPSLDAWCPVNDCLLKDESGRSFYIDKHHLTAGAGANYLLEKVLKPYLDEK
jgi:hypothetical protein